MFIINVFEEWKACSLQLKGAIGTTTSGVWKQSIYQNLKNSVLKRPLM
jgi:hypothetical protein